jgi:urocanate reductase
VLRKLFTGIITLSIVFGLFGMAFAGQPGFIPPPNTWDETYEVIVVGGGFAGLSAAYFAKESGADVVLVDKMPFVGGNSIINGGIYASYTSKLQLAEKMGEQDSPQQHIEDTIAGGDFMGDPALVENLVLGSPIILDLLLDNGLQVRDYIARVGGHSCFRTYTTINQNGSDIVRVQKKMVDEAGVPTLLNTKMTYIYREKPMEGRVLGIRVETAEGERNLRATKGLILTCGGFANNKEMVKVQAPWISDEVGCTNHVGATGEGLVMAKAVGANSIHECYVQLYPFADPDTGILDAAAVVPCNGPGFGMVYVNSQGKRYVDEGERRDVNSMAALNSGGFPTFSIFSDEMVELCSTRDDIEKFVKQGRVLVADTLEELVEKINSRTYRGEKINMPVENLLATIRQHNGYIEQGVDPDFGKKIEKGIAKKIVEGPFYAIPQWPSVHHTMGGLKITPRTEVEDIWGNVIPGLFAAGEVTGGVHGTNRLGSNAIPDAAVHGMIAGVMAATGQPPVLEY